MDQIKDLIKIKQQAKLLHSGDAIEAALKRLSTRLTKDYADKNPIFLVVMNGGLIFAGKLLTSLNFPLQIDYCHVTRYQGETNGAMAKWTALPQLDVSGRDVIIVDDILDEGYTLVEIGKACKKNKAKTVKTLVLIEKIHRRKAIPNLKANYCELQCPDEYVFGFGMDYKHYWRNTNEIYILNEST
ncbi:MAG: hypoxanthine-guanine phosphoribosyltransferase [Gammaproteobacteria bacterium]|nr:hypoxanthine-guanine phosphoribosyltransferase [Gammaproteobacteria bacterium]MDH5630127.1 hypoxanthine-guanine phosphoribosyltransferase [Gammaproteobacteria bacterium]